MQNFAALCLIALNFPTNLLGYVCFGEYIKGYLKVWFRSNAAWHRFAEIEASLSGSLFLACSKSRALCVKSNCVFVEGAGKFGFPEVMSGCNPLSVRKSSRALKPIFI